MSSQGGNDKLDGELMLSGSGHRMSIVIQISAVFFSQNFHLKIENNASLSNYHKILNSLLV